MKKIIKKNNILNKSEKIFILIGILGLFPFVIGLFDLIINKKNLFFIINLPKYYGSIILTFLGAKYWGTILSLVRNSCIPEQIKFFIIFWSVTPSILAITILSIKSNFSLLILCTGFLLSQLADEIFNKYLSFPSWYLTLRRILTLVVFIVLMYTYLIIQTS